MRSAFISQLHELARHDRRVVLLTADNGAIVFDRFRAELPRQFIVCGVCEATMMTVAAGLAASGKIPFVYTITPFLLFRAYEQIRNDVCLQTMNVKIVGIGGGIRYSTLGPTHHAIEDIAAMKVLPGMTIISPADPAETGRAVAVMKDLPGPVYLRMGTSKEPAVYQGPAVFELGKAVVLREGADVCIMATGSVVHDVLAAADELARGGISAGVINLHTLKPLDCQGIVAAASRAKAVLTVEEHNVNGGLGESVAAVLMEAGLGALRFKRLGIPDQFCQGYGTHQEMKQRYGLSVSGIVSAVKNL